MKGCLHMGYLHFLDDWGLISYANLERRLGEPRYVPEATLEDELTEGTWNFPSVVREPETGRYIGFYGGAVSPEFLQRLNAKRGARGYIRTQILCRAESADGIHWEKPDYREQLKLSGPVFAPNQVYSLHQPKLGSEEYRLSGMPVYYDPYDPDPQRRYKYYLSGAFAGLHIRGPQSMAVSPDGIHWELAHVFKDLPAVDTPSSVFYNPLEQAYIINCRRDPGDRRIFFRKTKDWIHFDPPRLIMHPEPEDPPLVGFYGMPVVRYENIFIGLLWLIYNDPTRHALPNGPIECALTYSYDGWNFNRLFHRPFIRRNELGEHGGGCIYTGCMLVDENHQIRFYSGGSKAEHFQNQDLVDAALMLHTLRLDGFAYYATHAGRGRMRTRPFIITGDDLRVNVRVPYGEIRAQILDERGQVLPGFSFADCQPFTGDELFWRPRWSEGRTFGTARDNQRRQLEFEINTGEIYALRGDFEMLNSLWKQD
jgi:hypothetical protein